jgi:hypothetical protein
MILPVLAQYWNLYFERSFSRIGCSVEQIDKDPVVELAVAALIGAPDANSRAEIANLLRIRQRSAHTDDEGRLLWEAQ